MLHVLESEIFIPGGGGGVGGLGMAPLAWPSLSEFSCSRYTEHENSNYRKKQDLNFCLVHDLQYFLITWKIFIIF